MAVTEYCDKFEPDGSGGYENEAVSAQAITDINANNRLRIMLLGGNDFTGDSDAMFNISASGGFINADGGLLRMSEYTGTLTDPKLVVTYTDSTTETHYADTSGNYDDAWIRTLGDSSEANMLSARNAEDAEYFNASGTQVVFGCYSSFLGTFLARAIFQFSTNASKTASSANLHIYFNADVSGFINYTWSGLNGIHVAKMSGDVTTSFKVADWSHIEGWESSGSYAAEEEAAVVYNATFFGANF